MPKPHAAVSSNNSPVLFDGELRLECADEELCKLSTIGSPSDTTGTHWLV
jgi:hypothetical protein